MATTRDYYEILGLERGASDEEIKRSFRKLAQQWHPDVNTDPDADARFKEINEAYQVLRDPLKRGRYLLELRGIHLDDRQGAHQDAGFLMQQMELRESLAEVRQQDDPLGALNRLGGDIEARFRELETRLGQVLDADAGDAAEAAALVQKMQFFTRLRDEVQQLEADLEDELL